MRELVDQVEVACPACGARLLARPLDRRRCARCEAVLAVVGSEALAVRGRLPTVSRVEAEAAFAGLFERDGEPEPGPFAVTSELLFVPFVRVSGTMVGISPGGRAVHRWAEAHVPAVEDRDDLGIAEIDPARLWDGEEEEPDHDRLLATLHASGTVLARERDRDALEAVLAEEVRIPADGEEAMLVDRRLALVYYPVWRLCYAAHGFPYQATIDGLTGSVLLARVPAKQRRRIFVGVAAAACLGYVLGTMLRHERMGLPGLAAAIERAGAFTLLPVLAAALVAAGLYVLLLNAAWNALRYRNELVYHSGLKTRVLVNRPVETWLDLATGLVKRLTHPLVGVRRFDR